MAKVTISFVKGRGSLNHNNREFVTENVDKNRIENNITYKKETLEEAYQKLFGAEVERYNQGKKPCRKIGKYMEHIRQSKNGEKLFYENVVQLGDKFSCGIGTQEGETAKQILDRYMRDFQKRNPNLYVFNAVLHMDEATPHLHIDYIPVAHGYKTGLQIRNSLDKALKEQGIKGKANKKENSTHNWQNREKEALEEVMKEFSWERKAEKGISREHLTINQYKAVAEQIHNEVREMPKQIDTIPTMMNKEVVKVKVEDLEKLEERAKLSVIHEKATKKVEKASKSEYAAIASTRSEANELLLEARRELIRAQKARKDYEYLYSRQISLNEENQRLKEELEQIKNEAVSMRRENSILKSQMTDLRSSIEEKIQSATEPLKKQIKDLKEKMSYFKEAHDGICLSLANVVKAVNMLRYDEGYKVQLTQKQSRLLQAIENYTIKFLKDDKKLEYAKDVKEHIGISKGIDNSLKELNKSRDIGR